VPVSACTLLHVVSIVYVNPHLLCDTACLKTCVSTQSPTALACSPLQPLATLYATSPLVSSLVIGLAGVLCGGARCCRIDIEELHQIEQRACPGSGTCSGELSSLHHRAGSLFHSSPTFLPLDLARFNPRTAVTGLCPLALPCPVCCERCALGSRVACPRMPYATRRQLIPPPSPGRGAARALCPLP